MRVVPGVRRRIRPAWRTTAHQLRRAAHPTGAALRQLPVPRRVRLAASRTLLRRPDLVEVPLDRLLLGSQGGQPVDRYAARFDDLFWASTPISDGPHARLLELAAEHQHALGDEQILTSPYGEHARRCIQLTGGYFQARDDAGIVDVARRFVARAVTTAAGTDAAREAGQVGHDLGTPAGHSGPADPILVAPIRDSDCYQILDGHHRLALLAHAGTERAAVCVKRLGVTTPLQRLLGEMSWLGGTNELYQPLHAPELQRSWTTVRQCTDRWEKIRALLTERGLRPTNSLDVASCYGWFVHQFGQAGVTAEGVERDPLARRLGAAAYGLRPDQIHTGDAVDFLVRANRRWDIVCCFSLLHHFLLGRGSASGAELVRALDQATATVLFLDTGQEHEAWFTDRLAGWDAERVRAFLAEHTTFDAVIDLGPDADAVGPYAANYGRHLFACVRTGGGSTP